MRVLWVCNIMLPRIAKQLGAESSNKEGWLSGLCDVLLERRRENGIELHVAYPVQQVAEGLDYDFHKIALPELGEDAVLYAYGFCEDVAHAERYEPELEERLDKIINHVKPDVIHCFGTEFAHTLAVVRACEQPKKVLVGIQGLCQVIAKAYMADLPEEVQNRVTFRDWLKQDSIRQQQRKFAMRGEREPEIIRLAGNVTGRTRFDRYYTQKWNPNVCYYSMNETLRNCFYEGEWQREKCEPHTIFLSQGDYPLKGLHYLLMAVGKLKTQYPDIRIKVAGNSIVNYKKLKDKLRISAYGAYLRSMMKQYRLEDRVQFLGRLNAQEMKEEYLKCGLFVCCSSNENSPNSLGEAMLLGVPCVAANVGGISTIFSHGEDGILYEGFCHEDIFCEKFHKSGADTDVINNESYLKKEVSGFKTEHDGKLKENAVKSHLQQNVENLQQAIVQMWENPEKMEVYCKNARKHARLTHDKEANYQKMTEIYAEIKAKCQK